MIGKWGRRMEDHGHENPQVVLARIDENIKFLKHGAEAVRVQLNEHEKQDDDKFKELANKQEKTNGLVLMASGGLAVIVAILDFVFKK